MVAGSAGAVGAPPLPLIWPANPQHKAERSISAGSQVALEARGCKTETLAFRGCSIHLPLPSNPGDMRISGVLMYNTPLHVELSITENRMDLRKQSE